MHAVNREVSKWRKGQKDCGLAWSGLFARFIVFFFGLGLGMPVLLAQQNTSMRQAPVGKDAKARTYTLFQRSVSPLPLPKAIPELRFLQPPSTPKGQILAADGGALSLVWPQYVEEKFQLLWQYAPRPEKDMPPWRWEIRRLLIEEAPAQAGHAQGELRLEAVFYALDGYARPDTLFTFSNTLSYTRPLSRISYVDGLFYRALSGMRDYTERWLAAEQGRHPALARGIRVRPYIEEGGTASDTVFYASGRTLSWSDFRGRMTTGSRFNASIFTTLAMDFTASMEKGFLEVPVRIRAFMLPRDSWVRPGGQSAYALNHEQRHFDMVQIVSLLLKGWLEGFVWSRDDFEGQLNQAFMRAYRLMNRLQEAYDADTSHGQRKERQALWDRALDLGLEGDFQTLEGLFGQPLAFERLPP
ncbi:MAG: hypothetical protein ACXIT9_08540 [Nitritalea sp.]